MGEIATKQERDTCCSVALLGLSLPGCLTWELEISGDPLAEPRPIKPLTCSYFFLLAHISSQLVLAMAP